MAVPRLTRLVERSSKNLLPKRSRPTRTKEPSSITRQKKKRLNASVGPLSFQQPGLFLGGFLFIKIKGRQERTVKRTGPAQQIRDFSIQRFVLMLPIHFIFSYRTQTSENQLASHPPNVNHKRTNQNRTKNSSRKRKWGSNSLSLFLSLNLNPKNTQKIFCFRSSSLCTFERTNSTYKFFHIHLPLYVSVYEREFGARVCENHGIHNAMPVCRLFVSFFFFFPCRMMSRWVPWERKPYISSTSHIPLYAPRNDKWCSRGP